MHAMKEVKALYSLANTVHNNKNQNFSTCGHLHATGVSQADTVSTLLLDLLTV